MNVLLVVAIVALLVGVLLLVRGVRGRKVDSYPHCRRCGFNLHGRWPETVVCSECGAALEKPRAVKHGKRKRRWVALGMGVVLLIVAGGPMVMHYSGQLKQVQLIHYAPFWWLMLETESGSDDLALAAINELQRREQNSLLTPEQLHNVMDAIFVRQGDPGVVWLVEMGDFVEQAWDMNSLQLEQWQKYLDQGFNVEISTRTTLRVGGVMPMRFMNAGARLGSRLYSLQIESHKLVIDGKEHSVSGAGFYVGLQLSPNVSVTGYSIHGFEAGEHHVTHTFRYSVYRSNTVVLRTFDVDVTVVSENELPVEVVNGPQFDDAMRDAVRVVQIRVPPLRYSRQGKVQATIHVSEPPVGFAFDVMFQSAEHVWYMGTLAKDAGGRNGFVLTKNFQEIGLDPRAFESLNVILITNPTLAEKEIDLDVIWDGEIVIEDVPVVWD